MKTMTMRTLATLAGLMAVLGTAPAAYADDTELFRTQISTEDLQNINAAPNILFILDTSGSMDAKVVTQELWDPDETFDGDYDSDKVYFDQFDQRPSSNTDNWFWKSALHCNAAVTSFSGGSQYKDFLRRWKAGGDNWGWKTLRADKPTHPIECKDDAGIHGEGAGGNTVDPAKRFATNGIAPDEPWSNTSNINWNRQYTLYDGNLLNWEDGDGTTEKTRLRIVQEVVNNLLDSLEGVNVGLMRFNDQDGGPILQAIAPIATNRQAMKDAVDGMDADGWTPLSETLYEAGQYYAGRTPFYGDCDNTNSSCQDSVANSMIGGIYDSPINFSCQKNYIVLLTDGAPTRDRGANSKIPNLPGFLAATAQTSCQGNNSALGPSTGPNDGICLDEMSMYLKNHDMSILDGDQEIITHTIGFTLDLDLLADTAANGGGEYKLADDTTSLSVSLNEIILNIFDESITFTSPAVPVNAFNRTQNLADVYVSIFEPSKLMHWPGNLKKYKLQNGKLIGQNGVPAVDVSTGFFNKTPPAISFWSDEADGDDTTLGGAANKLPAWNTRNVYSNLTGTSNVALTNGSNSVTTGSTITAPQLGIANAASFVEDIRAKVIEWARGKDNLDANEDFSIDDDRYEMGAPLHVRPVTVIYGGTAANPDAVVHTMTNDGFLHAINTRTGEEEWSFIPQRLLGRLYGLYVNGDNESTSYGLDGGMVVHIMNNDFIPGIDTSTEKAILLFGQRRGGDAMFALDVSVRGEPTLLWTIDPGSDPALAEFGQTWSTPTIKKVSIGGTTKHVAIMGGGYDDTQDATGYYEDQTGNAVYMIDVETGDVVWSAGANAAHDLIMNTGLNPDANATMKHSIPSRVQAVDLTGDGFVNRIYAGDMGGRIWRFDINDSADSASELVEGGLLASIGAADLAAPVATDVRRLYSRADVVPVIATEPGHKSYISLNIGSGHRAHPLEMNNEDWFFSIRDFNVFNTILTEDYDEPVMFGDLIDITNDQSPVLLSSDAGWRLKLEAGLGEKSFSESLTFKGTTLFTTFTPTEGSNSCQTAGPAGGTNRIYRISVLNGSAQTDEQPDQQDKTDRYELLAQGGIAPGVVMFFTNHDSDGDELPGEEGLEHGQAEEDCYSGTEQVGCGGTDQYEVTYWFQDETQ